MLQRITLGHPMVATDIDFAAARIHMVDSQIRPNKVTDKRLLAALRSVARERFLPEDRAALAYVDEDVKLGGGRVLMQPMVLARLLQAAAPLAGERALVVAGGAGYGAAVLAACGVSVTLLESDAALLARARSAATAGVTVVSGPLEAGWPGGAPYDIILLEGAYETLPPVFGEQLVPGAGRFVGVRRSGGMGQAVLGEVFDGRMALSVLFDCATPVLPALRAVAGFVF